MAATISNPECFLHLAYHVFLPPQAPQTGLDQANERQVDSKISETVVESLRKYQAADEDNDFDGVIRMVDHVSRTIQSPLAQDSLCQDLANMDEDDTLVLYIRAQNAAVFIHKLENHTSFEIFGVQSPAADVMSTPGKLVRHYPEHAVEVPNQTANAAGFMTEIARFLAKMDIEEIQDAVSSTRKARSSAREIQDVTNPNYFIQLFLGMLRGMGTVVTPRRVVKRVADQVLWQDALKPWRRSPIWLIIRVALQMSLDPLVYKHFMAYCHAEILSQSHDDELFTSDLLYAMRVKAARRLYKLGESTPHFVLEAVRGAVEHTEEDLQRRWQKVHHKQSQAPRLNPDKFNLDAAVNQSLPNSGPYLREVFNGRFEAQTRPPFAPNHQPRLDNVQDFLHYANSALEKAFAEDKHVALFDFEASVFNHLTGWTDRNIRNPSRACKVMCSCFLQYHKAARNYYSVDVADRSVMVLTLLKIWVAIDKLATAACPLLLDFSPELADDLVDSLLLRTSQHIDQAKFVQEHIRARYDRVIAENDSVFADEPSDRNFGFQYFQRSPRLKALKTTIESDAQKKKDAKIRELHEKNTEYARLDRLARQTNHSFSETRTGRRKHDRRCQRCSYERSRDAMTIRPYEWPLPERPFEAEMAVFELDRPAAFTIWRDRTFALLVDVGSTTRRPKFTPHTTPDRYEGLESYVVAQAGFTPRITVGSSTKPYNQSNFYGISIPATEDQVCVNNTLKFQLYDRVQGTTAAGPFAGVSFAPFGTLKLGPTSVYRHIGYALEGTEHTSNQVLADQFDCPKELGLHEHYAFGTLRSGPNLQWMNILRGLEENILTFSAEEVYLLHTQAAWQLGPLSNEGYREWHEELDEEEFGTLLVAQSRKLLGRVMANWLEATSVLTVVQLVARLLSSWPPEAVLLDAYQFLREARQVTFNWLRELQAKLQAAEAEQDIIDYQFRVFEMAAICRSTFDVDPDHLANLLVTYDDVKEFIKCAVAVYENEPVDLGSAPRNIQVLACRDRRLSHLVAPSLLAMVRGDPRVLCEPLLDIWPDYSSATGWQVLAAPNSRWVSTTTLGGHGLLAQTVHLNLLEGRLLIDGMPLGRLPREYVKHATYIRLFGQKILDVVPASIPGMEFSTRDHIHGYQVSFVLGGERLLIQARKDGQTLELIPHWDLLSDFAEFFSTDYHHWANITTKNVEFRLLDHPWSSERAHRPWMLRFGQEGTTMENSANNSLLIDFHSPVFKSLARQFEPLEVPTHLHITSSHDEIEIELPRLKLSFFLNDNLQLESRNFRGQILDKDQSVGTLLGLKHQLVLCAKDPVAYSLPRSRDVLVPYGDVTFGKLEDHVSVEIGLGQGRHVPVYRYKVDEDLGYLASDAGLTSRLFKIYLHAITSHCLPDPLTGRTGTEEALSELSESATSSFNQIDVEQAKLLKLIGSLTPKRKYHPAQLKSMQTTHWVDLPILSQHYAFSTGVTAILRRADTLQMFYPLEFKLEDYVVVRDASLLQRSARQTSVYYPSDTTGYLAQILDEEALHDHSAPDSFAGDFASQGQLAAWASRLAFKNWGRPLFKSYNLVSMFQGWGNVEVSAEFGSLTYSSYWLHPTLSSSWMTMYDLCRRASTKGGKFGLVTFIATVAFGGQVPSELLPVLVAFGTNPAFRQLPLPSSLFYNLWDGYQPELFKVQQFVSESVRDMALTPANNLVRREEESHSGFARRKQAFYDAHTSGSENRFTQHLLNQWPSTDLNAPTGCSNWFFVDECIARATAYFSSCAKNVQLRHHLRQVEGALSARPDSQGTVFAPGTVERVERPLARPVPMDPWGELHLHNLMRARECPDPTEVFVFSKFPIQIQSRPPAATTRLANLFAEFQESQQPLNRRYGDELDESRRELDKKPRTTMPQDLPSSEQLVSNRKQCHKYLQEFYEILESSVGPLNRYQEVVAVSGLWPRITPRTLLQQMSLKSRRQMEDLQDWQEQIVGFAQVFVDYQRTQRLIALAESGSHEEFYKELDFSASGFEAETNDPDWLLVQIDGNFSARSVQRQVAHEMILPSSKSNTVLQLNMGEGKSSVIVPIISASLANTEQLVRVVVLKPLWRQMFHLLVNRLSGLANRRIYYLPFGRNMKLDSASADKLQALYTECMQEGGIMLAQPEHILSFKLMGIDQLISSTTSEEITAAYQLRLMQDWLTNHARDILDESDEILHVQYQLVYTVGEQQPLEDHPDRWITTQQILQLAATHIRQLSLTYSDSLKHESGDHGQFPAIRVMPQCDGSTEQQLILAVANDVLSGRIHSLNCARLPLAMREYVLGLLVNKTLEYSEYEYLRQQCDSAMWKGLLLVRGLLASGILVFALKNKHYRVDYGLDLSRSLLAVPYRAKDIPSLRAEFGHPDVAVVLTCLSYYYKGLTDEQLDQCFDLIYKQDNPPLDYQQWVQRGGNVPADLQELNGVNIKDRDQFQNRIIPTFSRNSAVVDFFLSSVVFPKAAKEFPHKLSTSGWDLAERKPRVTTGFSGTNDNRYLLPTSIDQADPVNQLSTNALVLTYLLQPENNHYLCMRSDDNGPLTTEKFLRQLVKQKPEIRVLLDVGAQMLELRNDELVRCWLYLRPDIEAAVYFNDQDELVVLPQNGIPSPLYSSPYAQQLDKCIVYLDDGHTRGTDLKLPRETRALVTLGPKVTKDRLLQGCMRMRKLGHGQSVMFAAPPEIDLQIRKAAPRPINARAKVDALDVLRWAMLGTCNDLYHHVSHWVQQGIEYDRRAKAQARYEESGNVSDLKNGWTKPEARPLEEMYGVTPSTDDSSEHCTFIQQALQVPSMRQRLETLSITHLQDPGMDEEQEREVSHEVEREQQIERPPKGAPATHSLHDDVKLFIESGTIPPSLSGIKPLFRPLSSIHPDRLKPWTRKLYASLDFLRTLAKQPSNQLGDYMRPVNWIVRGSDDVRLVLSPFEVNELLPFIRQSPDVQLHVYSPRVIQSMKSFSDLQFYSVPSESSLRRPAMPSRIQLQLDLFAGQLYLSNHEEYKLLCAILGLYIPSDDDQLNIQFGGDGFVQPEHREELANHYPEYSRCKFTDSPIPMLKDLVGRRRKEMKYLRTHIGQTLHGRSLTPADF